MSVTDRDRGASYLIRRAAQISNGVRISVGVPEDAGTYPDGTPVAKVAAIHEFGLGNIPQRSFIRGWYDSKGNGFIGRDLARVTQRAVMHSDPIHDVLAELGQQYVKEVQQRMDAHIPPPLEKKTIASKRSEGSSTPETPLENTHQLREAITYKVEIEHE